MRSKAPPKKPRAVVGRPPASRAGDVDTRILEAAAALFLARGFEAASCEQVAVDAGCGKASIYARYADKSELFEAVITSAVERSMSLVSSPATEHGLEQRLANVCTEIVEHALSLESVQFLRLLVSEAARFPVLVAHADRVGRDRGVALIAAVLIDGGTDRRLVTRATAAAGKLIDLTFAPLLMRALVGDPLPALRARVRAHVTEAVQMLAHAGTFDA